MSYFKEQSKTSNAKVLKIDSAYQSISSFRKAPAASYPDAPPPQQHPMENASVISRTFMRWMDSFIHKGVVVSNFWPTYSQDKAQYLCSVFLPFWNAERRLASSEHKAVPHRVEKALIKMILPRLTMSIIVLLLSIGCSILQPFFIQAILNYLVKPDDSADISPIWLVTSCL